MFLVLLIIILLLILGVVQLGIATQSGRTPAWDQKVMKNVREYTDWLGAPIILSVKEAIRDISALGSMAVLGLLSVTLGGYFLFFREYKASLTVLFSWLGSWLVMDGLKYFYARTRPDVVEKLQDVTGYSFPSGHTMVATVVYLTTAFILADRSRERFLRHYVVGLASIITFMVGFSRVYLGVHYPSDVLGGWGFGLIFVIAVRCAIRGKQADNSTDVQENR